MLMPSIFGENLFDDSWMDFPFDKEFFNKKSPLYGKNAKNMMKTDIRETDGSYELDVDLPGFKIDEISATLGKWLSDHLRIERDWIRMRKTKEGKYIRQGALRRSDEQKLLCR